MSLAYRVIPTILCCGRQLIKGMRFAAWRRVGVVAQQVRIHAVRGVDEVALLDISATPEGRGPDLALIEELADVLFAPLAVGGGVRSVKDMRALLRAGADKVVIGTGAAEIPNLVRDCADAAGSQAVVVAIDVGFQDSVMIRCGTTPWSHKAVDYAQWVERAGAGEILLTSIDQEGTMKGYDLWLIGQVAHAVRIPVIAHGGCKDYKDMAEAIRAGASAVAAGAMFQFTDQTPKGAAQYLSKRGIEARL